jgi:hypothetical protein
METQRIEFNHSILRTTRIISLTQLACLPVLLLIQPDQLVPVLVSIQTLNQAITNLLECITHLSFADNKFNEFRQMILSLKPMSPPDPLPMKSNWSITHVHIERDARFLQADPTQLPLPVPIRSTILVRGSSGHGKSTLVKALCGQIPGLCIDYEEASRFKDFFFMSGQGAKHKLEFESLSLLDLFDGASSLHIFNLLSVCLLDEWLQERSEHRLSQPIFVSGGERNRLTLAYHIHLALNQ